MIKPAPAPDSTTPGVSEITLRTSSTGRLWTPVMMTLELTSSRGTIGFAAAVTLMVPTCTAEAVILMRNSTVCPPNTRALVTSVGW